ncbi:diguanylate cyclase [Cellvibrio sp. UBA7661]|uniref:substrate-binding periplasmic protein n=1 Tax=Cellvibrio sp. UBA7661 TaxID=1946311 RepID=UPI002F360ABE
MPRTSLITAAALFLLLSFSFSSHAQDPTKIATMSIVSDLDRYAVELLKVVFEHTDGKYVQVPQTGEQRTQARVIEDIKNGVTQIMWAATDQTLESELTPIRIPILKGFLGHRIFLIRKGDQARFDHVKTLDDLKQIKLGQGTTWADTKILQPNNLNVVTTQKFAGLMYMLDGGRFDAFPRGVSEPWSEVNFGGLPFEVEKRIMLVYKMPMYFFTNKSNSALAKDIELGLNRAIADGSFDKVFFNDPSIRSALEKADIKNRIILHLDNPTLSKETPIDRPELWLDVNSL